MSAFERAVWQEAKSFFNNPKLRLKDLREWSTGPITPREGEITGKADVGGIVVYFCVGMFDDKR